MFANCQLNGACWEIDIALCQKCLKMEAIYQIYLTEKKINYFKKI